MPRLSQPQEKIEITTHRMIALSINLCQNSFLKENKTENQSKSNKPAVVPGDSSQQ